MQALLRTRTNLESRNHGASKRDTVRTIKMYGKPGGSQSTFKHSLNVFHFFKDKVHTWR